MGNRSCRVKHGKRDVSPVVPDRDPLLRSAVGRISKYKLGRDFELTDTVLGTGYSGAVRLAKHRTTKQEVAVKQFTKKKLPPHRLPLLKSEVEVYLRLDHPNICRLLSAYEDRKEVWLVMELCGPELYARLCQQRSYSEHVAAEVLVQMLQAVNYLHSERMNVVHRDLKLENWLYGGDRLKLIDFGFSRIVQEPGETLDMPCGTLHYTPPEVLERCYTSKCDLWSIGVIAYMLLLGRPPFRGESNRRIASAIVRGDFNRSSPWCHLSHQAQDFVERLLTKDAARRPDAATALEHCWLSPSRRSAPSADLSEALPSLRRFAQGSKLRRAALTVLAYSLTSGELKDLEDQFVALDRDGRGVISLEDFQEAVLYTGVEQPEVENIFQSLGPEGPEEEVAYTPFVAALLATRVQRHEDKVRAAFEAFDRDRRGYVTAQNLVDIFGVQSDGALQLEEAQEWIREVDYKGNGVLDYEEFLAALKGRPLCRLEDLSDDQPAIRVFDTETGRPRGHSDSDMVCRRGAKIRHGLAAAIIDEPENGKKQEECRAQTFQDGVVLGFQQKIRHVTCAIDESYFA